MNTKLFSTTFMLCLPLVFGVAAVNPHQAAVAAPIVSSVSVQSSTREIGNEEWKALSLSAGRMIKHTDQAHLAIVQNNSSLALEHIAKGLKLAAIIENAIPSVQVETEIKSGDLVYKDSDDVTPLLIPIYNNMFRYDIMAPVMRAKNKGDGSAQLTVMEAGVDYSTEYLNVRTAKTFLESAQRLLNENKFDQADNMLSTLLDRGVSFENVMIEMPLSHAVDLMAVSQRAFNEGNDQKAEATLRQASNVMANYIKTVKTKDRIALEQFRMNLDELADIVHDQARHQTFSSKFSHLWNDMTAALR